MSEESQSRLEQLRTMIPGGATVLSMAITFLVVHELGYSQTEALGAMALVWNANLIHSAAYVLTDYFEPNEEIADV